MAFAEWCALQANAIPELKLIYHVPNGGARPHRERVKRDGSVVRYSVEAQKLQKMGVKKGVLDYHLPLARTFEGSLKIGLWIEFKSRNRQMSPEQISFASALEQHGHQIVLVRDWETARKVVVNYIGLPEGTVCVGRKH